MRKLAFFVEGQTERIFVQQLILSCAGEYNVQIVSQRGNGGRRFKRIYIEMEATNIGTGDDFYVLIIDSGSDEGIVTDIRDRFDDLVGANYSMILGLRDVRPSFSKDEVEDLQAGMAASVADIHGIPIEFYLSIMEIEAWFLAENSHFSRIAPELTRESVIQVLGFFPDNQNVEDIEIPSHDLADIYGIAGIVYDKSQSIVQRVVGSLNFDDIINIHSTEIGNLGGVVGSVNNFFRT